MTSIIAALTLEEIGKFMTQTHIKLLFQIF